MHRNNHFLTLCLLFMASSYVDAEAIFKISQAPDVALYPNSQTPAEIGILVQNMTAHDLPDLRLDTNYAPNRLVTSSLGTGWQACQQGATLRAHRSCLLYVKIHSHKRLGRGFLLPRVCAYSGFLCSRGQVKVQVAKTFKIGLKVSTPKFIGSKMGVSSQISFTLSNPSATLPITHLSIVPIQNQGITRVQNSCGETIAPYSACQVKGEFTPPASGESIILKAKVSYKEGDPITLSAQTQAIASAGTGQGTGTGTGTVGTGTVGTGTVGTGGTTGGTTGTGQGSGAQNPPPEPLAYYAAIPVPLFTKVGEAYPFNYVFTNQDSDPVEDITLDDINLKKAAISKLSTDCTSSLKGETSCHISGVFTPQQESEQTDLGVTLTTASGNAHVLPAQTTAHTTGAILEISNSLPLPPNTKAGQSYPVAFSVKNRGTDAAKTFQNSFSIPNFVQNLQNQCPVLLLPGTACEISGRYTVRSTAGKDRLNLQIPVAGQTLDASTSTYVSTGDMVSVVSKALPTYLEKDVDYKVAFTFYNDTDEDITNLKVVENLPHFKKDSASNCVATLKAHKDCTIKGTFKTQNAGPVLLWVRLVGQQASKPMLMSAQTEGQAVDELHLYGLSTNTKAGTTAKWQREHTIIWHCNISKDNIVMGCSRIINPNLKNDYLDGTGQFNTQDPPNFMTKGTDVAIDPKTQHFFVLQNNAIVPTGDLPNQVIEKNNWPLVNCSLRVQKNLTPDALKECTERPNLRGCSDHNALSGCKGINPPISQGSSTESLRNLGDLSALTFDAKTRRLYITTQLGLVLCKVDLTGDVNNCIMMVTSNTRSRGAVLSRDKRFMYLPQIVDDAGGKKQALIEKCPLKSDGTLANNICTKINLTSTLGNYYINATLSPAGDVLYTAQQGGNSIYQCPIDVKTGDIKSAECQVVHTGYTDNTGKSKASYKGILVSPNAQHIFISGKNSPDPDSGGQRRFGIIDCNIKNGQEENVCNNFYQSFSHVKGEEPVFGPPHMAGW